MFTRRVFWLGMWLLLVVLGGKGIVATGTYNVAMAGLLDLSTCEQDEIGCSISGLSYPPVIRAARLSEFDRVMHWLELAADAGIGGALEHVAALSYATGDDARALALLRNGIENQSLRSALWHEGQPPYYWVRSLWHEQQGSIQLAISDLQTALERADFRISVERERSSARRLDYLFQQLIAEQSSLNATDVVSSTLYAACAADWQNAVRSSEQVYQLLASKDEQTLLERVTAWSYRQLGDSTKEASSLALAGEIIWDQWSIGDPYLWLAQRLLIANPYVCGETARGIFEWYSQAHPDSTQGLYLDGLRLFWRRAYTQALTAFESGYQRNPNDVSSVRGMAISFESLGRLDEAVLWYQKAIQLVPQDGDYHVRLARVYHALGQVDLAQAQFDEAIALSPEVPEFLVWAAYFYLDQNQLTRARELFEEALKIDPENPYVQQGLAQIVSMKEK